VSDEGLVALAGSPALQQGKLHHLDLSGLTRTTGAAIDNLLHQWVDSTVNHDARPCRVAGRGTPAGRDIETTTAAAAAAAAMMQKQQQQRQPPQLLHVALSHTAGVKNSLAVLSRLGRAVATEPLKSSNFLDASAAGYDNRGFVPDPGCPFTTGSSLPCNGDDVAEQFAHKLSLTDCEAEAVQQADAALLASAAAATTLPCARAVAPAAAPIVPATTAVSGLCGLELAGCNMSGNVLTGLAATGVLSGVTQLDLSDVECLRLRQQRTDASSTNSSSGDLGCGSTTVFQQLFAFTGSCLLSLTLDGCNVDCLAAAAVARSCPRLQLLSVVGCKGLTDVGLQALVQCSPQLVQLAVGGAAGTWGEGQALSGLTGLTELKVIRRSNVTDAALAPVLTANSKLMCLSLIGCYCLTDQLFDLAVGRHTSSAAPAAGAAAWPVGARAGSSHCWGVQHQLTQLVLVACDGLAGFSVSRLRGLQRLRVSFCNGISRAAVQQLMVSCTRLTLLELPARLQCQDYQHEEKCCRTSPVAKPAAQTLENAMSAAVTSPGRGAWRTRSFAGRSKRAASSSSSSHAPGDRAMNIMGGMQSNFLAPLQGSCADSHMRGLKVVFGQ
jgi:F-box/leucine-rich repeat protein 2/20